MCVIVYKPMGIEMANIDTLKKCWEKNPHGAGIMVARDEKVIISKGFMTWNDFVQGLNALAIKKEEGAVIHFRIASHGKISRANCHPFPIANTVTALQTTNLTCMAGLAHNGIINIPTEGGMSDTMTFIKNIFSSPEVFNARNTPSMRKLINNFVGGSKIIILFANGKVNFFGLLKSNWKTVDGCMFSNLYWQYEMIAQAGATGDEEDEEGEPVYTGRTVTRKGQSELSFPDNKRTYEKRIKVQQLTQNCPECGRASMTVIDKGLGECQWCGQVELIER